MFGYSKIWDYMHLNAYCIPTKIKENLWKERYAVREEEGEGEGSNQKDCSSESIVRATLFFWTILFGFTVEIKLRICISDIYIGKKAKQIKPNYPTKKSWVLFCLNPDFSYIIFNIS